MSLKLAVRSDFPPKDGILTVSADTTLAAFREQASELLKIASSELAKYQLLAVAFGNDVRAIKADEKESLSAAGIKNQDVLIYAAYGEKRPKIKDKRKEEVESKEEAKQVKAAKYPGLSIKNALAKAQTLSGSKQEMAMEFIDIYLNKISATKEFLALKPEFLTTILKRNTLNIKEVDLFSAVLKWGQAECKRQDAEATPDKLKEVLADMLPLIRFPTMTSQDVALKVAPANLLSGPEILEIFNYLGLIQAGKDPEVSTLGRWITTARKGRRPPNWFVWSAAHKGPNVMLEEDGIIARHTNSSWSTVGGSELIESGVWEWEITLTNYNTSNSYNVAIGVVPENFSNWSLTSLFGYSGQPGWAFITGNGNVTSGSTSVRSYGNSFCATGDKVSVRVDKDANTIEFGVNGVWKGVAFSDVTGKVRPALGLVQNQTVTLGFPE